MEESVSVEGWTPRGSFFEMKENIVEEVSETLDITTLKYEGK